MENRPFGIGAVPNQNKIISHENWKPNRENNFRFGFVEYEEKLSFEEIKNFELRPVDDIENANYYFWFKGAEHLKNSYAEISTKELEQYARDDPFAYHMLNIKKGA